MHGTGDTVHLTEACDRELPHLVTPVTTTIAPATAVAHLLPIQQALIQRPHLPRQQRVAAGDECARNVIQRRDGQQVDLVDPVDSNQHWQARTPGSFAAERFRIAWEQRRTICPGGHSSIRWRQTHAARQRAMISIDFDPADCWPGAERARCTRAKRGSRARRLTRQSPAEHEALLAGCQRHQTAEFAQLDVRRAGIAGTCSQGVRAFGRR